MFFISTIRKNRKHSLSEELKAIELYESGYGSTIIGRRLKLEESSVKYWIQVYLNRGCFELEKQAYNQVKSQEYEILSQIKQGRPAKAMGRPKKKLPETELEKLQEELRYLRAENAYLKK